MLVAMANSNKATLLFFFGFCVPKVSHTPNAAILNAIARTTTSIIVFISQSHFGIQ